MPSAVGASTPRVATPVPDRGPVMGPRSNHALVARGDFTTTWRAGRNGTLGTFYQLRCFFDWDGALKGFGLSR